MHVFLVFANAIYVIRPLIKELGFGLYDDILEEWKQCWNTKKAVGTFQIKSFETQQSLMLMETDFYQFIL